MRALERKEKSNKKIIIACLAMLIVASVLVGVFALKAKNDNEDVVYYENINSLIH